MIKQKSWFGFVVAGLMVLLLIGITGCGGGFYSKMPFNRVVGSTTSANAAAFVSKQAPVMVSVLGNPDTIIKLAGDTRVSKLKKSLFANTEINYNQDIRPWLGNEITLAVTSSDIDRDPENGKQAGYLMAIATQNPQKSREFIDLLFSQRVLAGTNIAVEQYKGVKLIYENPQLKLQTDGIQNSLAGAMVGDRFVLFANKLKVLRAAINNLQAPDVNLTSSEKYQQAVKKLPKKAVAVAFLNLPAVAEWQGLELAQPTYNSEIIALNIQSPGLVAETSFQAVSSIPTSVELTKPVEALKYIPASAGLVISGKDLSSLNHSNLAQLWHQVNATKSHNSEILISRLFKPLLEIEKRWDIDLSTDIFSWVTQEYAIALLPAYEKINPEWIFVAQKTPQTANGITRLDAIASKNGLTLSPFTLDDQQISTWTKLTANGSSLNGEPFTIQAQVLGAHTSFQNYEIFASSVETLNEVLKQQESLIDNGNFKNSIAAVPTPNQGYLYIDWTKSQQFIERQLPILKLAQVVGKPFFERVRSLTLSSYDSDANQLKGGIFFQLD